MKTFTIIVGLNDQKSKRQEISTDHAELMIANYLWDNTDGATLSRCRGIYKHEDGTRVIENSIKIEISGITQEEAERIAAALRVSFNQESVYFSVCDNDIKFIDN